jgi:AcrR family transcriptional regulator
MTKRLPRDPQKEQAILTAAVQEFGQVGYQASTDKIAELAGVSKGSVFRYFNNKQHLYYKAVQRAIDTIMAVVDFSVWTDSKDLVSMIIRATKYKTELSHQFPNEFGLLMRVYTSDSYVPKPMRDRVTKMFTELETNLMHTVIEATISHLNLRPGLDHEDVQVYLTMFLATLSQTIQQYFEKHPDVKKIEDMSDIIDQVKSYMDMLEHGIVVDD